MRSSDSGDRSPVPAAGSPRRGFLRSFGALAAVTTVALAAAAGLLVANGLPAASELRGGDTAQAAPGQTGMATDGLGVGAASSLSAGAATSSPGSSGSASLPPSGAPAGTSSGTSRPWTAWKPTGVGSVVSFQLKAPWSVGLIRQIHLWAYLPAGYATSNRAYPVVYEAPFGFGLFNTWMGVESMLDREIAAGDLPAAIYVFAKVSHSPIPDSECADSTDGSQLLDSFLTTTMVQAVDQQFRTIQTPAARAFMGFSQGGYCAAMLTLRHPDVFGTAISISGYYQAGVKSSQTPNAWRPFGGQASAIDRYSPLMLVTHLTASQRQSVQLILEADPAQPFYGPQFEAMVAAAHRAGVSVITLTERLPHSWPAVKLALPTMLADLARRQVALGVFG